MKISSNDKDLFVEVFTRRENGQCHKGYILDFSDRTFQEFFKTNVHIDIFKKYKAETSKAKKFSKFLITEDLSKSLKIIKALLDRVVDNGLEYDKALFEKSKDRYEYYKNVSKKPKSKKSRKPLTKKCKEITAKLNKIYDIENAQTRGYAFEQFLNYYFNEERLKPREPFKISGQQVDGSIELNKEIYLIEAKWKKSKTGTQDIIAFQKKVEDRSGITRGVFISFSGYSNEAVKPKSIGNAKIILVEVDEIKFILSKRISLKKMLEFKIRLLAEEGKHFAKYTEDNKTSGNKKRVADGIVKKHKRYAI